MTGGYTMKEKNIRELAKRMGLITVENMCQYTIAQLVVMVANKVNELVNEVWRFETDVQEMLKTQNENIQYLLGEGLHLEVENIFDGWVQDGTFDTLINQSALKKVNDRIDETNAQLSQTDQHLNSIGQIAIRLDGELDDTQAIQRVIDSDKPLYVDRDLIVSDTIRLKLTSVIIGKGKNSCSITMTNDNKWMFRLLTDKRESPYDVVTSLKIHDVCLIGKNILQLNELSSTDFNRLGHIKGGSIERVLLKGKVDNGISTTDIPTADELRVSGVAIQATKCFDMAIRDCEIERFGIAIDFLGSDINLIDNCRIAYCQRIYHGKRISTYGSQNKIKNCDLMHASKKGHIYLEGTFFDTIEDNYFEAYNERGMFIAGRGLIGTTIMNNRFDANGVEATPEIQLSPITQVSIINNRFNTGEVGAEIKILETDYQYYYRFRLSRVEGNVGRVNLSVPPMYMNGDEPDIFNARNILGIDGQVATSYPFELVDGVWKLKKTTGNVILTVKPKVRSTNYKLVFNTYDTGGTYHVNVYKDKYQGTILRKAQTNKGTTVIPFQGQADLKSFVIEFITNSVDMESIRVINDYN